MPTQPLLTPLDTLQASLVDSNEQRLLQCTVRTSVVIFDHIIIKRTRR